MDSLLLRVGAIFAHALLNVILVSYALNYDITGSWIAVILFAFLLFILLALFIKHLILFIQFLKNKTK